MARSGTYGRQPIGYKAFMPKLLLKNPHIALKDDFQNRCINALKKIIKLVQSARQTRSGI